MTKAQHRGRSTRTFRRLAANLRAQRRPCCICGQPIDYTLEPRLPDSFTVEHIKARSTHPELAEDPGNFGAAHLRCNSSRGNRNLKPGLGLTSEVW